MTSLRNLGPAGAALTLMFVGSSCSPKQESAVPSPVTPIAAQSASPTYALALHTNAAPKPGVPVQLSLLLTEAASGLPPKLKLAHEKLMHLIVVRKDLGSFQHLHPDLQRQGKLTVKATFPTPGEYLLFADFTPEDGEQQIARQTVTVQGSAPTPTALTPDADQPQVDGNLKAMLVSQPERLIAQAGATDARRAKTHPTE